MVTEKKQNSKPMSRPKPDGATRVSPVLLVAVAILAALVVLTGFLGFRYYRLASQESARTSSLAAASVLMTSVSDRLWMAVVLPEPTGPAKTILYCMVRGFLRTASAAGHA